MATAKNNQVCGVYKIMSPSGNFYIGSSFDTRTRWSGHKRDLRKGKHHSPQLQRACDKYGLDALQFEILLICGEENARMYEQIAIDSLNPSYNATRVAGQSLKDFWKDPEWRKRQSERRTRLNKEWHADPENKEIARLKAARMNTPEARALSVVNRSMHFRDGTALGQKMRATSSTNLRTLFSNPNFAKKHSERKRLELLERCKDPEFCKRRNEAAAAVNRKQIRLICTGEVFQSKKDAAVAKGISISLITKQMQGKRTKTGFRWEFLDRLENA